VCWNLAGLVWFFRVLERFFLQLFRFLDGWNLVHFYPFAYEFTLSKTPAPRVCYFFTPVLLGVYGIHALHVFFFLINYTINLGGSN
jgi:hypothetical protein